MNAIMKIFTCGNSSLNSLPSNIKVYFDKLKILISYSYLDLSLVKEIISIMCSQVISVTGDLEYTPYEVYLLLRKELKNVFIALKQKLKKEFSLSNYYEIVNYSLFFLLLVYNMRNYDKLFYEVIFEKQCKFQECLIKIIKYVKASEGLVEVPKIFANLFLDENIVEVFKTLNLDDIYQYNIKKYTSILQFELYRIRPLNEITHLIYVKLLDVILNVDLNYETIFKKDNSDVFLDNDKPLIKSMLVQSIVRIVISQEKYRFIESDMAYESIFIQNVVTKCVMYYYEKFGENFNCLFRREEIVDDVIKYFMFISGNCFFYKSCFVNLKALVNKYTSSDTSSNAFYLTQDEFLFFYEDLLEKMKQTIPNSIRILLKMIYEISLDIYKPKLKTNNFSPVLTILFFNFIISPKIQDIYGISPMKNILVRNINRVIRNICFNEKFKDDDDMSYYNNLIEICHVHTNATVDKMINSFAVDDLHFLIRNEIAATNKLIEPPPFLFYYDCDYVLSIFKHSMDFRIDSGDLSKEVEYIEKVLSNRTTSFLVKFNLDDLKNLKFLDESKDKQNDVGNK